MASTYLYQGKNHLKSVAVEEGEGEAGEEEVVEDLKKSAFSDFTFRRSAHSFQRLANKRLIR